MISVAHAPRVAYQGERGDLEEEIAVKLFGDHVRLVPRPMFEPLITAIDDGEADYVLAPIENSLMGYIYKCYDLLLESSLFITAEVTIPVRHNLIGCPGASFDSISTVESHPITLGQCEPFFTAHPKIKRIATEDIAGSVRTVLRRGDPTYAAIAGRRAAETYGGVVILEDLEGDTENYTRFVLLTKSPDTLEGADKLSLLLKLEHRPGSLYDALEPLARRGINLLRIVTRPIVGRPWEYYFYLDLCGSIANPEILGVIEDLKECATQVRLLGCYPSIQEL